MSSSIVSLLKCRRCNNMIFTTYLDMTVRWGAGRTAFRCRFNSIGDGSMVRDWLCQDN
jgi:hypothetical protein